MAGKIGRSGRRSLTDEVERARVRQAAWKVTGQFIESNNDLESRAQIAVGVVKADMAKPIIVDQSQHLHLTAVEFKDKSDNDIIEFLTGRPNGISPKPA